MPEIVTFSEASSLYAENFQIVEAMRKGFDVEVAGFYDRVRDLLEQRATQLFREKTTSGFRYWWIGGDEKTADKQPRLWFDIRKVEVVIPGKWELIAGAPLAGREEILRVRALAQIDPFRQYCEFRKGDSWNLFALTFPTCNAEVDSIASTISELLEAFCALHQEFI